MSPKRQGKRQQKDTSLCFPGSEAAPQFGGRGTTRWAQGAAFAVPSPPRRRAAAGIRREERFTLTVSGAKKPVSDVDASLIARGQAKP